MAAELMVYDELSVEGTIAGEVDELLNQWRSRALSIVLALICGIATPVLLIVMIGNMLRLAWPVWTVVVALYLTVLLAALRPHWDFRRRAAILGVVLLAFSAIQIVKTQLPGSGRLTLMILPLFIMILVGVRAGWVTAAVSVTWFVLFSLLSSWAPFAAWLSAEPVTITPQFWVVQGLMLILNLLPVMFLNSRFQILQSRTMVAERQSRLRLERESAARARLESEILRINEEEKRRLGSELHDGLCQNLTAALLHCNAVETRLVKQQQPEAEAVTRLRAMIEEAIGSAYDVAKGLSPVDLDPESLVSALHRLARNVQERSGIRCDFVIDGPVPFVVPEIALHLYRIAQEATINAVKHAKCRQIVMELSEIERDLVLEVRDDGVPEGGDRTVLSGGMGRQIMAYRAGAMGGVLTITEPRAGGTVITCRVPVTRASGADV